MHKKILSFVLAIALLFTMAVAPVHAQSSETFTVKVDSITATAGESRVAVGISLENNLGIDGFSFCVEYDSDKLVYADATIDIDGYKVISQQGENSVNLAWAGTDTYTQNGQIATVYFNVPKNVLASEADVTITYRDGYDSFYITDAYTETDIAVATENGKITISAWPDSSNTAITVENISINATTTDISVPITISNNRGVSGFSFCINYDTSRLILNSAEILIDNGYKVISYPDGYGVNLAWTDTSPYESNGNIANLHFSLNNDVKSGKAYVEIVFRDGYDSFYISANGVEEDITVDSFDGYVDVNNHTYGEWAVTTPATCTSTGIKERVCSECGKTETVIIPKTEHEYDAVITLSTCMAQGYTTHTCKTCFDCYIDTYTDTIDHTLGEWELNFEAECLVDGEEIQKCTVCNAIINRRAITAPGHSFGEWYVETPAEFNTDGTLRRDCSVCDAYETERIPKLSESHTHSFTGAEEIIEPATCTENGSKKVYCSESACGEFTTVTIYATGHTYGEWYEYSAATFDTDGENRRDCIDCDCYESERIPKRSEGHICEFTGTEEIIEHPTCTENGYKKIYCYDTDCGQYTIVNIDPNGHTAGEWTVTEPATCTKAGTKELRCTICNALLNSETIEATGHTMGEWYEYSAAQFHIDGELRSDCSECDYYETARIPKLSESHTCDYTGTEEIISNPTCTVSGSKKIYCTEIECGKYTIEDVDPVGHTAGEWEILTAASCTVDGTEIIKCTVCKTQLQSRIIDATGHTWDDGVVTKEANCVNTGEKTFTCTECNTVDIRSIPTGGHTEGDWNITDEATCTEVGIKEKHCTVCNQLLASETIPSTGHSYGSWTVTLQPTVTDTGEKARECSVCHHVEKLSIEPIVVLPQIKLSSTSGSVGSTIKVTLSLYDNPGIITAKLKISYDSTKLQLISVEDLGLLNDFMSSDILNANPYALTWDDALANENNTNNGDIAVLTFQVLECEAGITDIEILYEEEEIYDVNLNNIFFEIENAQVQILDYLIGDVNNDGKVDIKDATLLRRYVAEWANISINLLAADVNNDGKVNIKDATILRRYIAEWDGVEI